MLTAEANERLTRVGAGTPMGELMRRYWLPVRPYAQLLEEEVLPVRILGEDLVLFRTPQGDLGLVGDRCPHRAAKLELGIPDDGGIRCGYHGWKFSPDGQCVDTPLEAPEATLKDRIKIPGYPVQEMGGLVWAYMGPLPAPLLPTWDLFVMPNAIRQIGITELNCNWLQCQENTADPSTTSTPTATSSSMSWEKHGRLEQRAPDPAVHTFHGRTKMGVGIESIYGRTTQYGMEKGVKYSKALGAEKDTTSRHSTVIFPFYTQTGGADRVRQDFQIRVPIDDTHTYHICYGCFLAPSEIQVETQEPVPWYQIPLYDDMGKPILDFVLSQDLHMWLSQGEIYDRTQEHLGRTDTAIAVMRRQFEEQLRIVEDGGEPMNVFRNAETRPPLIHGGAWDESVESTGVSQGQPRPLHTSFRFNYHRGYSQDDADRYGPAMPQISELMRRLEELATGSPAGKE